jgi:hypothetical protein
VLCDVFPRGDLFVSSEHTVLNYFVFPKFSCVNALSHCCCSHTVVRPVSPNDDPLWSKHAVKPVLINE